MNIEAAIHEHEARCAETLPRMYVPWPWVVGIAISLIGTMAAGAWAISRTTTGLEMSITLHAKTLSEQDERIKRLEGAVTLLSDIRDDVATIKTQTAQVPWRRPTR